MTKFHTNLQAVRTRIQAAAHAARRAPEDIKLLAVSKTWPASVLRAAHKDGIHIFGENYVQEALEKMAALEDLPIEWHFIGPLQSNKTAAVATHFDWVHTIDRLKIAQRLSTQRPEHLPPLEVCLQVNVSGEASKSGIPPSNLLELAWEVAELPRLNLRGLMTVPAASSEPEQQTRSFRALRQCLEILNAKGFELDTLSMGMSADLEAAIAQGATVIRVGSALFGAR